MSVIYIRDEDGKFIPLPTVKGADYILTEEDKQEITDIVKSEIDLNTKLDKPTTDGTAGQVLTLSDDGSTEWTTPSGGSGGTTDYADLANKPKINGVELNGDIKPSDLGIKNGEDYVLTDNDKSDIANIVINEYDSSIMAILGGDNGVTE